MSEVTRTPEIVEMQRGKEAGFEMIRPVGDISLAEARGFLDSLFERNDEVQGKETDNPEEELKELLQDYFRDLKKYSECPDTIPDKPFDTADLKKRSPEENAEARKEFSDKKEQLKREWEEANGRPWPKYEHDVYSANGKLIRKAGSDYDAHHIQPLSMGGKNEASNITPLNAEVHYDKQGIHAPDSPCSKLNQKLGGSEL